MNGEVLMSHLNKILGKKKPELHIYSTDDVWCPPSRLPAAYVINTGWREGSGEHYVTFYMDKNNKTYYFDSFGIKPFKCLKLFWKACNVNYVYYSKDQLQSPYSDVCGYYAIAFIKDMTKNSFQKFLNRFSSDVNINDRYVVDFVHSLL